MGHLDPSLNLFGLVLTLILFALGFFDPELARFVPRFMVIVALLALFMQAEQLFKPDWLRGSLIQYYISPLGWGLWLRVRLFLMGMIFGPASVTMGGFGSLAGSGARARDPGAAPQFGPCDAPIVFDHGFGSGTHLGLAPGRAVKCHYFIAPIFARFALGRNLGGAGSMG